MSYLTHLFKKILPHEIFDWVMLAEIALNIYCNLLAGFLILESLQHNCDLQGSITDPTSDKNRRHAEA